MKYMLFLEWSHANGIMDDNFQCTKDYNINLNNILKMLHNLSTKF
jgi:hypothetical protein